MDDRALVAALLALDGEAWHAFDQRFTARLFGVFRNKGVAHQDQRDCFHHFYMHLMEDDGRRLRQWQGHSSLLTWLVSVARNYAVDWVRAFDKHQGHHVEPWDDDSVDAHVDPSFLPDPADPETAAATSELVQKLRHAFEQLPPQERRVATLRYIDARSPNEIAAALGIAANNVHQILHRVKKKLHDVLKPHHNDRPPGGGVTQE